jgi:hypothetical protein
MKNKFKLVETEDYLLAVSDEEIEKDDYFYYIWFNADIIQKADSGSNLNNLNAKNPKDNFKKIIAYKPKGNVPELDLPLLPEIVVEDEVEKLAESYYTQIRLAERTAFKFGYKAATKVYSEEDLKKMFAYAHQVGMNTLLQTQSPHLLEKQDEHKLRDGFIQSLKQPKWFVAEMKCGRCYIPLKDDDCWSAKECSRNSKNDLLLTTTINGKTYLVGTYLHS